MPRSGWLNGVGVILIAGVVFVLAFAVITAFTVTDLDFDAKQTKAQLGCGQVAMDIETYVEHPANTKKELPRAFADLLQPPLGGPSLLKYGAEALNDPWGNPYQFEHRQFTDGREYILIWTTAPNGIPISQFGFGKNSAFPSR